MANRRPAPKTEHFGTLWPPGTSGNLASYSHGRRSHDAIERLIEEMAGESLVLYQLARAPLLTLHPHGLTGCYRNDSPALHRINP